MLLRRIVLSIVSKCVSALTLPVSSRTPVSAVRHRVKSLFNMKTESKYKSFNSKMEDTIIHKLGIFLHTALKFAVVILF